MALVKLTIEQYLDRMAGFADHDYGRLVRGSFADDDGSAELAMLASPTADEVGQLRRAVAIMTSREKADPAGLTDGQIEKIARDACVDPAVLAIFVNGYVLECKRVS